MKEDISYGEPLGEGAGRQIPLHHLRDDAVILETALQKEDYSRRLYEAMYEFVERDESRALLEELIDEEKHHFEILSQARGSGDFSRLGGMVIEGSIGSPDYLVKEEIQSLSGPEAIVKLAIRREEEAEEFYLSRVGFLKNERLRDLYQRLAEEEARHREELIRAYDDLIIMSFI